MARKQIFADTTIESSYRTAAIEDYVQGIWILSSRGEPVIGARLAQWLGVKPPTVTAALKRMIDDQLIMMDEHKQVHLTGTGTALAEELVRRHRILERFLCDVLGLGWHEVHPEAHRLEHAISPLIEKRMMAMMGYPATCPHGNPIPGEPQPYQAPAIPLTAFEMPARARIQRIAEEAEDDLELMAFLESSGLVPGASIHVVAVTPQTGTIAITLRREQIDLDRHTAGYIWAELASDAG